MCVHIDILFYLVNIATSEWWNSFNVHNIWDHTNLCILVNRPGSISHVDPNIK